MARPKFEYVEKLGLYRKRIKDADGEYIAIYGKSPSELSAKVKDAQAEIAAARIVREQPTVAEYAKRYLELNTAGLSAAGKNDYSNAIYTHIIPAIGGLQMCAVTPDDIKTVLLPLTQKSASLHNAVLNTLRRIFGAAEDNGIIVKSPCAKIKRGGIRAKEKHALTDEQVATLLRATEGTRAHTFCMIGLYAGLRREEILGLQWDCVTLDGPAPHISVRRAARWESNQPVVSEQLKSAAARRDIPIPPQLVECLRSVRAGKAGAFVLPGLRGKAMSGTQTTNLWRIIKNRTIRPEVDAETEEVVMQELGSSPAKHPSVVRTIDFAVTPHILRHTYITNLILAGMDIKTVQYLAGHATVSMTLDIYTHLTANRPDDLIGAINSAFAVKNEVK